jgi:hypothetical protein
MSETFSEERNANSKIITTIVSHALPSVKKPPSTFSSPALLVLGVGSIWASSGDLISNFIS